MYFWDQIILWNSESANVWFVVRMVVSVTRLGDFWKFLSTKFLAKEVQIICKFLGYFEKHLMKKCIGISVGGGGSMGKLNDLCDAKSER